MVYRTGAKIAPATIGIEANRKNLLPSFVKKIEIESLLTDFHEIEEIPFSSHSDGFISITESEKMQYEFYKGQIKMAGPFSELAHTSSDLRFSFWGNLGLLYRYTLYLLEKKHSIYSLHACALYHPEEQSLYVIIGGAGSGKTVYLLSGLLQGLKLYSTETVLFQINRKKITWLIGSLVDNIWWGTLIYNFPQFLPQEKTIPKKNAWQKKIALDLSSYKAGFTEIIDPDVTIIFPHIEENRNEFQQTTILDKNTTARFLFNNISQKLAESFLLFEKIPLTGFDENKLAIQRLETTQQLLSHPTVKRVVSILSNPQNCWGKLLTWTIHESRLL